MERISLASYSFHRLFAEGRLDLFGYLESVKYRYRMNCADIWNGSLKCYDEDYLLKLRGAMDERELSLASLCCDWAHPWAEDEAERCEHAELAHKCLHAAVILGAKSVRFDVGVREENMSEEQYEVVVKAFREYAAFAGDNGFRVGPENHWGASRRLSVQRELKARVDSPAYGMLLHLGNWFEEDGMTPNERDLAASPMAAHTHVDYRHALVADACLPELRAAGYEGVWGLEHHTESDEYMKVEAQLSMIRLAKC